MEKWEPGVLLSWSSAWLALVAPWALTPASRDLVTWEVEAERVEVQGHAQLLRELEVSLDNPNPCLKTKARINKITTTKKRKRKNHHTLNCCVTTGFSWDRVLTPQDNQLPEFQKERRL